MPFQKQWWQLTLWLFRALAPAPSSPSPQPRHALHQSCGRCRYRKAHALWSWSFLHRRVQRSLCCDSDLMDVSEPRFYPDGFRETVMTSEAEVRECAIRFGHSVDVFTLLTALPRPSAASVISPPGAKPWIFRRVRGMLHQPSHGQRASPFGPNFNGHLIGSAANATRLHFHHRSDASSAASKTSSGSEPERSETISSAP